MCLEWDKDYLQYADLAFNIYFLFHFIIRVLIYEYFLQEVVSSHQETDSKRQDKIFGNLSKVE